MTHSYMLFALLIFAVSTVLGASASEEVCRELVDGFDSNNWIFNGEPVNCGFDTSGQSLAVSPGSDTAFQECYMSQQFEDSAFQSFCRATLRFDLTVDHVDGPDPVLVGGTTAGQNGEISCRVQGLGSDLFWELTNTGTHEIILDYQQNAVPSGITSETFVQVSFTVLALNGVRLDATLDNVSFKVCTTCVPSGAKGDPHFVSWTGRDFNYHGGCDENLAADDGWLNGKGLRVQIRTKIRRSWSFIKAAAIQIAGDTLEVRGSQVEGSQQYWFNGVYRAADLTKIGGLEITHSVKGKSQFYVIHIGNGQRIVIKSYREFVRVDFENPTKALYGNTVGILGNYTTGQRLARDGITVIEDVNEFGQHWQVQPDEPMLFHNVEGPQSSAGQKCELPPTNTETKTARGRRLSEPTVTKEDAEKACFGSSEKDDCVFDVLRTGDLDMAGAY